MLKLRKPQSKTGSLAFGEHKLRIDESLTLPRELTNPTAAEFVEQTWTMVHWLDSAVAEGKWSSSERSLMLRACLVDALGFIERHPC